MIYIFDLGSNDGCSIRKFKKEYLQNSNNYQIHSFEPHPFFIPILNKIKNEDSNIKIINKCATTHNNDSKLYYSINSDGSSLNNTKTTNGINVNKYIEVKCCNLYDYYVNNIKLQKNDELWLKMDIEGEEYNLIPYLKEKGMLNDVDKIFIEWHYGKLKNISKEIHNNSLNCVTNIKTHNWDAMNYMLKDTILKYKKFMKTYENNH